MLVVNMSIKFRNRGKGSLGEPVWPVSVSALTANLVCSAVQMERTDGGEGVIGLELDSLKWLLPAGVWQVCNDVSMAYSCGRPTSYRAGFLSRSDSTGY